MASNILGFISIITFTLVYFLDLKLFDRLKTADFTSFAAGVGTVYVFIHMLPQLAQNQILLEGLFPQISFTGGQYRIYVIALIGFIFFYMFDSLLTHTKRLPTDEYSTLDELAFYWTNVIFITLYNMLIGYAVGSYSQGGIFFRIVYLIAYALHFITIKWGIYHVFPQKYMRQARYVIVVGLFIGYFIGIIVDVSPVILAINEALLTGAMILNVFKHELPNEQDSRSKAFILGILSSGVLFMMI